MFESPPGDLDSDDDGEEDDYTAERLLTDRPDPATPGEGYKRFVGKDLPLWETRGSLRAVFCRGIPWCRWTISRKRILV